MGIWDEAKALLGIRKKAYDRVFDPAGVDQKIVLKDLARFCRANQSTFNTDPQVHALLEGRREVWLRITTYLDLTPEQLWELYGKE